MAANREPLKSRPYVTTRRVTPPRCHAMPCFSLCVVVMCVGVIVTLYIVPMTRLSVPVVERGLVPTPLMVSGESTSNAEIQASFLKRNPGTFVPPRQRQVQTRQESATSRNSNKFLPTTPITTTTTTTTPTTTTTTPTTTTTTTTTTPTTTFTPFLPCRWNVSNIPQAKRIQAFLDCTPTDKLPAITFEKVLSETTPVTSLSHSDASCLKRVIKTRCYDVKALVPRLAHYVWYGKERAVMPLHFFVGVLSVVRFLRPCLILFHGDGVPRGAYWEGLLQLVPNILFLPRLRPREVFGNAIDVLEHSADVTRLRVLLEYGGVYIDTDQYLLRPVTELLHYPATIGIEKPGENCGNGLIFSQPGAEFLRLWLARYSTFQDTVWAEHSTVVPYNLSLEHPDLVHVVESFFKPNYKTIMTMYEGSSQAGYSSWRQLFGLHLYFRFYHSYFETGTRMDRQSSVIGQMTRHVLFGSWERCNF